MSLVALTGCGLAEPPGWWPEAARALWSPGPGPGLPMGCPEFPVVYLRTGAMGRWANPVPCENCSLCNFVGVVWSLHMPFNLLHISLLLCKMGIRFFLCSASQVDEKIN